MNSRHPKLIRQLEQLQVQIDHLKKSYLSLLQTKQMPEPPAEPGRAPSTTDDACRESDEELLRFILQEGAKNTLYRAVSKKLQSLMRSGKTSFTTDDLREIQQVLEKSKGKIDQWEIFKQKFAAVHPDFFDKLQTTHPDLTKTELKFCAFIRIRLNSAQIASVLSISKEAIRKNRYRIRKKIGLASTDSLEEYILQF
jgi:DNA-binding CsgD family transcriptional regulator